MPKEFRGRPSDGPDSRILADVAIQLPDLSGATQEILRPFFLEPMYEGSWLWLRGHPSASATAGAPSETAPAARTAPSLFSLLALSAPMLTRATPDNGCVRRASQDFDILTTPHATIHYASQLYDGTYFYPGAHSFGLMTAQIVADEIEHIWTVETGLFGRVPPSDGSIDSGCNGGDGTLDITIVPTGTWLATEGATPRGITAAFNEGCVATPSHILIRSLTIDTRLDPGIDDPEITRKRVRDVLAHEFFHTIEFGYGHSTPCEDFKWLGEATANWAIDLVYHDDQGEQPYAPGYMYVEHRVPLDQG